MTDQNPAGVDIRRYLTVARRHVLLIAALTVALGVAAYAYSASQTPQYEATAQLLYTPQLDPSNPLSQGYTDPNVQELQMQSAVTLITGPTIGDRVYGQFGTAVVIPGHSVSATITTSDPNATNATDNGVAVTVDSTDPQWSAKLANAYANQFVDYRKAQDRKRYADGAAVVRSKLKQLRAGTPDALDLQNSLTNLEILENATTGDFLVAVPATPPSAPYTPKPKRSAIIGAGLGFILGVALAFLREKLGTRLHDHREVSEIVGLPVIGRVGKIPTQALAKGSLVVVSETDGRAAESIRVLRSNLQFASLGEENRVLMVMSAQKGEGKSLVTTNLAASLALAGKSVALIDADLRRPRVHSIFGLSNAHGVSSVIAGFCTLDDALQPYNLMGPKVTLRGGNGSKPSDDAETLPRLTVLTAGPIPPNPGEMVASRRFASLIHELADRPFDYVLIDSPAFLAVGDAAALAAVVDGIVLLVNMEMINRPTLEEARDFIGPLPPEKLGVITVMDTPSKGERYHYYTKSA